MRGDLQRHAGPPRDLDGAVDALLGRHAAEEREIVARALAKRVQVARQAVVDRRLPIRARKRPALASEIDTSGTSRNSSNSGRQIREVQPAVQGRHGGAGMAPQQREVQVVAVEVDDVEAVERRGRPAPSAGRGAAASRGSSRSRHRARGQAGDQRRRRLASRRWRTV